MEAQNFSAGPATKESIQLYTSIHPTLHARIEAEAARLGLKYHDVVRMGLARAFPPEAQGIRHEPQAAQRMEAMS